MKTYPELEHLRALDPAPQAPHDHDRAERLLRHILAEPRTEPPRRRWGLRPRAGGLALAAAAVVAAVAILLTGGSVAPSLVDRAYAAINAGDRIVHELDVQTTASLRGFYEETEGWLLPADGRARVIYISGYRQTGYVTITESVRTATGRIYGRSCLSGCRSNRIGAFINRPGGWFSDANGGLGSFGTPGLVPGTFARQFQAAYRAHAIVADGTTTFAGKRVAKFQSTQALVGATVFSWRPGAPVPATVRKAGAPALLVTWLIDPKTARPVGFTGCGALTGVPRSCQHPQFTTRIVTFERLDPTAANLATLTGPGLPAGS